jgi:hypothetical protein
MGWPREDCLLGVFPGFFFCVAHCSREEDGGFL